MKGIVNEYDPNQRNQHSVEKYSTFSGFKLSLTIRVYIHPFSCNLRNLRNPAKLSKNSNL